MSGRSREEYRPLNVRDALSYLDQVAKIVHVPPPHHRNALKPVTCRKANLAMCIATHPYGQCICVHIEMAQTSILG
jgi:hypothetical protein